VSLPDEGPWELPIEGYEVLMVTFAFPIDIVAYGDAGACAQIRLAGEFRLTEPGRAARFFDASKQPWEELTAVLSLRRDRIKSAIAGMDAQLNVVFDSGVLIEAGPDGSYENWEISGPGFQLIATPGGGVAVFRPDPPELFRPAPQQPGRD